jgi:hypothetical protein
VVIILHMDMVLYMFSSIDRNFVFVSEHLAGWAMGRIITVIKAGEDNGPSGGGLFGSDVDRQAKEQIASSASIHPYSFYTTTTMPI